MANRSTGFEKRRDPEARRTRVLDVAARLFAERGYESTSVNQVAADAGVSVGALYKYFPDKPALLEGLLERFEAEFAAGMSRVHAMPGSQYDKLHVLVVGLFETAASTPYFYWALTSGTNALRGPRERKGGEAVHAEIRRFIQDGIDRGEMRPVDVERMAALGFGVVETAMKRCFGPPENGARRSEWAAMVEEVLARAVRR